MTLHAANYIVTIAVDEATIYPNAASENQTKVINEKLTPLAGTHTTPAIHQSRDNQTHNNQNTEMI